MLLSHRMLKGELIGFLKSQGAAIIGFADLHEMPPEVRENLPIGISITVSLNPRIIAGIEDGPNPPYFEEYKR